MVFFSKITDNSILNNFIMDKSQVKSYLNNVFPSLINKQLFSTFINHIYLKEKQVFYNKKLYYYKKDIDYLIKKWLSPLIHSFNLKPMYDNSDRHGINTHFKSKAHLYKNNTLTDMVLNAGIATKNLKDKME